MNPDRDWKLCRLINACWSDDVQEEAILRQVVANVIAAIAHAGLRVGRCRLSSVPRGVQGLSQSKALCWLWASEEGLSAIKEGGHS